MPPTAEASRESYDVIVIGAGIGGLTAAALLAKAGQRVLVVERQEGPGGYAHSFQRGPYTFDPAVHWVGDEALFDGLLRHLGVRDRCTFLPIGTFYTAAFPDLQFDAPLGMESYIEAHARLFPQEAAGFRRFVQLCARMHAEAHQLPPRLSLRQLDEAVTRFPVLFKYMRATVGEVLDEYLTDPRLKALCTAPWAYLGLPPSRLSFQTFSQMIYSHIDGVFYCEGSFQRMADALVFALRARGGELVLGERVTRIILENGRAAGVELASGPVVRAPVIVSNADALQTFEQLVGAPHLPAKFLRSLRRLRPSISGFGVYAASRLDLPSILRGHTVHECFSYRAWDHDETWSHVAEGRPSAFFVTAPSLVDPSVAPPGEHLIVATALMPYDIGEPWPAVKERYVEAILAEIDHVFPGFSAKLTFVEGATPLAFESFTLNHRGAIYGWEMAPDQTTSKRPAHQTPIPGLYLSGHWTHPGGGVLRTFVSGIQTAAMIVEQAGLTGSVPLYEPPNLPPVG